MNNPIKNINNEEKIIFWRDHLIRYLESKELDVEYCEKVGISYHTFRRWRSKINKLDHDLGAELVSSEGRRARNFKQAKSERVEGSFSRLIVEDEKRAINKEGTHFSGLLPDPKWTTEVILHLFLGVL